MRQPPRATELTFTCPLCDREERLVWVGDRADEARLAYLGLHDRRMVKRWCGYCEVAMASTLHFDFEHDA